MLSEQLDLRGLESEMAARGIRTRWRRHEFVLRAAQELAQRTQAPVLAEMDALQSRGEIVSVTPFWIVNAVAVEARRSAYLALSGRGDVGLISPDREITLRTEEEDPPDGENIQVHPGERYPADPTPLPDDLIAINIAPAWSLGYDGSGRLVCDFDTGADADHPALGPGWRGNQPGVTWDQAWRDPYGHVPYPYDPAFHGTHTLGTMVARPPDGAPSGWPPGSSSDGMCRRSSSATSGRWIPTGTPRPSPTFPM
jgi:subtilisin family serine protease